VQHVVIEKAQCAHCLIEHCPREVLSGAEMRQLLKSIDASELIGLRDRALLGLMGYSFARISAVIALQVEDYFQQGRRSWLRLDEKGGKQHEVPYHHSLNEYLDAWIAAAGIADHRKGPLFRTFKSGDRLTSNRMIRSDILYMIKRRAKGAGLPYSTSCHTFRATGIKAYLQNGGTLEHAQQIAAAHQSPPVPRNSMTGRGMRFRSMKWSALNLK
jgi:integrase/recombinase XerD